MVPSPGFRRVLRSCYRGSSSCRRRKSLRLCLPRPCPSRRFPACSPSRLLRRASWRFHPSALHKTLPLVRERAPKRIIERQLPQAVSWCDLRGWMPDQNGAYHRFSASSRPPGSTFTLKDTGRSQAATHPLEEPDSKGFLPKDLFPIVEAELKMASSALVAFRTGLEDEAD